MSLILKALAKAQKRYADNAKAVLKKNEAVDQGKQPQEQTPATQTQVQTVVEPELKFNFMPVIFVMALIAFAVVTVLLNNRVTSRINVTNNQMADMLTHLKNQEDKVEQLGEAIKKLETNADTQAKEMNANLDKLNGDLTAKIGNLKGDLNNQKAVWDTAISEQGKAVVKTRELLNTYKSENEELKGQIQSLKERVDSTTTITTPEPRESIKGE